MEVLERTNVELKTRLDETSMAYEQSQRDLRTRAQEIQRLNHELEKTREAKDSLSRENKKLAGRSLTLHTPISYFKHIAKDHCFTLSMKTVSLLPKWMLLMVGVVKAVLSWS